MNQLPDRAASKLKELQFRYHFPVAELHKTKLCLEINGRSWPILCLSYARK